MPAPTNGSEALRDALDWAVEDYSPETRLAVHRVPVADIRERLIFHGYDVLPIAD